MTNKIIIWGIDDFNTLGLLREYKEFQMNVFFLIKGKASYACKSKYSFLFNKK